MGTRSGKRKWLLIIIIIFCVTFAFIGGGKRANTISVYNSVYENKINFKGIHFADEWIVYEGDLSNITLKNKPGTKVSRDSIIAEGIKTPEAGIIVDYIDGYENKFNIKNIRQIDADIIDKIAKDKNRKSGIKVVSNNEWLLCLCLGKNPIDNYRINTVKEFYINDLKCKGEIYSKFSNKGNNFIIIRPKDDIDILNLHRGVTGYIIKSRYKGVIVPTKALIEENDSYGVLVKQNGYAKLKKVEVKFKNDEISVLLPLGTGKGELKENDEVILNNEKINNGDKVK